MPRQNIVSKARNHAAARRAKDKIITDLLVEHDLRIFALEKKLKTVYGGIVTLAK